MQGCKDWSPRRCSVSNPRSWKHLQFEKSKVCSLKSLRGSAFFAFTLRRLLTRLAPMEMAGENRRFIAPDQFLRHVEWAWNMLESLRRSVCVLFLARRTLSPARHFLSRFLLLILLQVRMFWRKATLLFCFVQASSRETVMRVGRQTSSVSLAVESGHF